MADDTKNVFISHIHEDDAGLGKLKNLLNANGMTIRDYSISSDNPNNAHSEDYIKSQILVPRIQQCSTVVVYVSSETKDSDYVNWEIEYGHKAGKRIIIDAIKGDINEWQNPDGSPSTPRQIKRYSCA